MFHDKRIYFANWKQLGLRKVNFKGIEWDDVVLDTRQAGEDLAHKKVKSPRLPITLPKTSTPSKQQNKWSNIGSNCKESGI